MIIVFNAFSSLHIFMINYLMQTLSLNKLKFYLIKIFDKNYDQGMILNTKFGNMRASVINNYKKRRNANINEGMNDVGRSAQQFSR